MDPAAESCTPTLETLRTRAAKSLGIPAESVPRHIAIIMDGNGRWALKRELSRSAGHQHGAQAVRKTITHCARLGIEVLTLYSFSLENWKRPGEEVDALMALATEHLIGEREELCRNNIQLLHIGRRDNLPSSVQTELANTIEATKSSTGLKLVLALNYGSRAEMTDAVRTIAEKVKIGELNPEDIEESTISHHLNTAGLPDPDLLIRTAGEYRLSNYLLWQLSYAEIHVTDTLWPDFTEKDVDHAICDYAARNRRYGGLDETNS